MGQKSIITAYGADSGRLASANWRNPATGNEPQTQPLSTVGSSSTYDDGFVTVINRSRKDSAAAAKSKYQPSSAQSNNSKETNFKHVRETSRARISPPSAAAASRTNVYAFRPKSIYQQGFLPIEESDSAQVRAQANKSTRISKEAFRLGMIIRAAVHEQELPNTTNADKSITDSKFGPICTKYRKMIIIALHQDHYLALPMFTHNGKGLVNKARPDEFISVQDHRLKGEFTALSSYRPLVTEHLNAGIDLFHPKSTIHITYPLPRRYEFPLVYEGFIDPEAVSRLLKLFNDLITKA